MDARSLEATADFHCILDLQIRRQNSCESISSLNSLTSMSSVGSLKDQDAKKKKKKSWVRNNAFCVRQCFTLTGGNMSGVAMFTPFSFIIMT